MAKVDVVSHWSDTLQFAVVSTPRRLRLTSLRKDDPNRYIPWDYLEIDNRGNKGNTVFWAVNGRTASSSLATGVAESNQPLFRLPPDSIDRVFIQATSVSILSQANGTTIFVNMGRF